MKRVIRASTEAYRGRNPREAEYFQYLDQHIFGVQESWHNQLKPAIVGEYDPEVLALVDSLVYKHDASKYNDDEFIPYCNYFYPEPSKGFSKNQKEFDEAWLLHQHRNPHHWQHWVLVRDEGIVEPQDIPIEYILEMLCDWHSFSKKDPTSTAYSWYDSNKSNMKLSDNTSDIVEKLIEHLKDPIEDSGGEV